ncbi:ankyrin repeat domain-containing protein 49-like [Dysidea avara]|uniref:ankyrin repeat domain-containing protein 49-like n=1 Tax=Dysidea avara TaxID=196820 RepID=UPI0033337467
MAGVPKGEQRKPTKKERDRLRGAVEKGSIDDIKELLSSGVDVNADLLPPGNITPLHYAAWNNQPDVIRVLHEYGADINCQNVGNWTPLHFAANRNHPDVIRMLHECGADINCQDEEGRPTTVHGPSDQHYL